MTEIRPSQKSEITDRVIFSTEFCKRSHVLRKIFEGLSDNHNSFYLTLNICSGYFSLNIICSPKFTVFLNLSFALGKLLDRSQLCTFSFLSIVDREAVSSPENSSLLETDHIHRRISSENIFAPNDHDVLEISGMFPLLSLFTFLV